MIAENLKQVEDNINKACQKAGRNRSEVTLIAVSKTKPISMMEEAITQGIRVFGENKVQEIVSKEAVLGGSSYDWHMIGHLQRNKVKQLVGKTKLIHSVDSERLAKQISEDFAKQGETAHVLIEVNVAKEDTKFGVLPEDAEQLIRNISTLPNLKIDGLMTIAPYVEDANENRIHFQNLRKLLVDINSKNIDNINMSELSMGMTGDYQVAIEEGATYVRVGTGIFGARQYNIQ